MTRKELIEKINDIVKFITNGTVERDKRVFNGHPAFYLMHSKEEFERKLNSIVIDKDSYDRYDLYYYMNYMFKYMLDKYDSHTHMIFIDNKKLPIKIKIIDGIPYIVDGSNRVSQYRGAKILSINGVSINDIILELEKITCYASYDFLKIMLEDYLSDANVISSLPILNKQYFMVITTDKGDIRFDLNNLDKYEDKSKKRNYTLDVINRSAIITYNSCKDEEKMIELVNRLNSMPNIESYVIDLRGNGGGNSLINRYLVDYLKEKKFIVLCDERVFSSARMCLIDLKNIGAKIIGSNPGTSINCFGNSVMQREFKDMNLRVNGSATYWYYDKNLQCHGIYKENFNEALKQIPNLLEPIFLNVDERVDLSLTDYINHQDSVLEYALSLLEKNKSIK